jgi:hypothetical protein
MTVRSTSDGFSANLHLFGEFTGPAGSCSPNCLLVVTQVGMLNGREGAGGAVNAGPPGVTHTAGALCRGVDPRWCAGLSHKTRSALLPCWGS